MPFIPATIQKLCTPAECALYNSSKSVSVKAMTRAELCKAVERARALRDKNRDLFRRQSLDLRKKGGVKGGKSGVANLRTQQKAAIFDEALTRFEKQLKALDAKKAAIKSPAVKKAAPAKKPATAKAKAQAKTKTSTKRTVKAAVRSTAKKTEKKLTAKAVPTAKAKDGFAASSAKSKSRKTMLQSSRSKPIQGHIKSSGKRAQAKRDSR